MIKRALAPGIFLVTRTAVGTDELDFVLLRIAVQSGPARAANTHNFRKSPFHRLYLPKIHVHANKMPRVCGAIHFPASAFIGADLRWSPVAGAFAGRTSAAGNLLDRV